jgi:hypothetical protein
MLDYFQPWIKTNIINQVPLHKIDWVRPVEPEPAKPQN